MRNLKKSICIVLFLISYYRVSGQQYNKELDFVIVIDENVWITSTYFQIVMNKTSGSDTIKASYHPGSLSIMQSDYDKLLSEEAKSIYLKFVYYDHGVKKQKTYNYEIELKKPWLQDYFNVLRIYNLDNKKYKKLSAIAEGKNYTYELESPSHSFRRVRDK